MENNAPFAHGDSTTPAGGVNPGTDTATNPLPSIAKQSGGGAIRGMGETFSVSGPTGTASATIPLPITPGRSGKTPRLQLTYDSGLGNGPFGLGWQLSLPAITRKTDKGLPRYLDNEDSDTYMMSGVEDLVPVLELDGDGNWVKKKPLKRHVGAGVYDITTFRPRVEGAFLRIERWLDTTVGTTHWRVITPENVTSIFGDSNNSRIYDPTCPNHVFTWLIARSFDEKGNLTQYDYKAENTEGVDLNQPNERYRPFENHFTERYLKRVRYGNTSSHSTTDYNSISYLFEVVFDYGDHHRESPTPQECQPWKARMDPFSTYRATFEIRTYRICQRILMFHNFPDEASIGNGYLTACTELTYDSKRTVTLLTSALQRSYMKSHGKLISEFLPPVEFHYSQPSQAHDYSTMQLCALENAPIGADGAVYQFLDLDAEGLPGILSQQAGEWSYKPNLGNGRFGPTEILPQRPEYPTTKMPQTQWLDLNGDGRLDLVQLHNPVPGYSRRDWTVNSGWENFQYFQSLPNINWSSARFADLTGDGLADVFLTEDNIFTVYPSCGEDGFTTPEFWHPPIDEDKGPRLLFENGLENVYLADMSGDGLVDFVRVRNGEICYWPNLGYGRFGSKVSMANAPFFEEPDIFAQHRIQLADVDGSGTTDLVAMDNRGPIVYLNEAGNGWAKPYALKNCPPYDDMKSIQVVDLLGRGTSCLVFSSRMLSDASTGRQMLYMDLMTEGKPYLLKSIKNNFGTETSILYTSSTQFYIDDKLAGNPWITRLPFPVQVVSKVVVLDRISGNQITSRYAYHHGFFDPFEREYRGFGLVEKWDAEEFETSGNTSGHASVTNANPAFTSPPVLTKTWYDTGAYLRGRHVANELHAEFYEGSLNSTQLAKTKMPNSIRLSNRNLPYALTVDETREAVRSLRGTTICEEVYGLDNSPYQNIPYMVRRANYKIELFQPQCINRYAIFFTQASESLGVSFERNRSLESISQVEDPKISHDMVLVTDIFGNTLESLSISYGRRHEDPNPLLSDLDRLKQGKLWAILNTSGYTEPILEENIYRTPVICESQVFEIINLPSSNSPKLFNFDATLRLITRLQAKPVNIPFEDFNAESVPPGVLAQRLMSKNRVIFRKNDMSGPLPFGRLESLGLPYRTYTQALTPGLLKRNFLNTGNLEESSIAAILQERGGFVQIEGDPNYWTPSGQIFFSPAAMSNTSEEKQYASHHFYLPYRYRDPFYNPSFHTESEVRYDKYDLLPIESRDPKGNCTSVGERAPNEGFGMLEDPKYDYRVLQPLVIMEANRNRTKFFYDTMGVLTTTAVQGKPEENIGDELTDFPHALDDEQLRNYFEDPLKHAKRLLGNATARALYDLHAYYRTRHSNQPSPPASSTIQRETHISDLELGQESRLQHRFAYQDGLGRICQSKGYTGIDVRTEEERWLTSGWTVFNNKGNPVQKFEPLYTSSHLYQRDAKEGVSSIFILDPLQRTAAILNPNHTWSKTILTSWAGQIWDANDVCTIDPTQDIDVKGYFERLPADSYSPTWYEARQDGNLGATELDAARKAAVHAKTPTNNYSDALGRTIVTIAHNELRRSNGQMESSYSVTRADFDSSSNSRRSIDQFGRVTEIKDYDMLRQPLQSSSMDAGTIWVLRSCVGKQIYQWTSRGFETSTHYDLNQRLEKVYLRKGSEERSLISAMEYGETLPDAETLNTRGRIILSKDQSGVTTSEIYDFKGNLLSLTNQITSEAKLIIDWSIKDTPHLQSEIYRTANTYDALNRSVTVSEPDGSLITHRYNRAGQIERVSVELPYKSTSQVILADAQYNARGQRTQTLLGNGVETTNFYDPLTFRLSRLFTLRQSKHGPGKNPWDRLQDLRYTYDAVGNVTFLNDDAKQSIFFSGEKVDPSSSYTYDALYRLIEATGREGLGQSDEVQSPNISSTYHRHDGHAMGNYLESYFYDLVGNIMEMRHARINHSHGSWTKHFSYNERSNLEPQNQNNRLTSTRVGNAESFYKYEGNEGLTGNITSMAGVPTMRWNFRDQLHAVASQRSDKTPHMTWYTYNDGGQRVRKVAYSPNDSTKTATRRTERLYIGSTEVYREFSADGDSLILERWTLHILVGGERVAMNETLTKGSSPGPVSLTRFQHANLIGSSVLELDYEAQILTYEEYYPYGETSYFASHNTTEAPKRYRYSGKERDDESGFYYYGSRYYAPWIGRWISPDPGGLANGPNLYNFSGNNPITFRDPSGNTQVVAGPGGVQPMPPPGPTTLSPEPGGFGQGLKFQLENQPGASSASTSTSTSAGAAESGAAAGETGAAAGETGAVVGETSAAVGEAAATIGETGAAVAETEAATTVGGVRKYSTFVSCILPLLPLLCFIVLLPLLWMAFRCFMTSQAAHNCKC
jgi:RHS repeat-associated protein